MGLNRTQMDEQEKLCWQLRIDGYTQDQIADTVGISQPTVSRRLAARADKVIVPLAEEWRRTEIDRLQMVINRLTPLAVAAEPDLPSLDRYLKAVDLLAKYTGAQQPVRIESTVVIQDPADAELAELIQMHKAQEQLQTGSQIEA